MSSPAGTPPIIFTHGPGRGPGTQVQANPVVGTPQTGPAPTGSKPYEKIDHTVAGPKPHIDYRPGAVDGTPVSVGDVHDFHDDPTRPSPTVDIGGLGGDNHPRIDQGIQDVIEPGSSGLSHH
jgi:hypothetical protein